MGAGEEEEDYRPPPKWFKAKSPFFLAMYELRYMAGAHDCICIRNLCGRILLDLIWI